MTDPSSVELGRLALLYLAGELTPGEREAFESRLESDPQAQEHFVEAVQLHNLLERKPLRPSAQYRETVRQKVLPARSLLPFRWGLGFALAASLAITALNVSVVEPHLEPLAPFSFPQVMESTPEPSDSLATHEREEDRLDMAEYWAEMSTVEHYQQLTEDESRRRPRTREPGQMMLPSMLVERTADSP